MKYWVRVQGQNIIVRQGGTPQPVDFSVTRTVWAVNAEQASTKGVRQALKAVGVEKPGALDVSVWRASLLENGDECTVSPSVGIDDDVI